MGAAVAVAVVQVQPDSGQPVIRAAPAALVERMIFPGRLSSMRVVVLDRTDLLPPRKYRSL
jgi:hypothetical protein